MLLDNLNPVPATPAAPAPNSSVATIRMTRQQYEAASNAAHDCRTSLNKFCLAAIEEKIASMTPAIPVASDAAA